MFSKVFLVCAFAFYVAQAHHDVTGEDKLDRINPLITLQKPYEKYPYYHDIEYQKQTHEYPYHIYQNLYQHPYFAHLLNKYHDQTLRRDIVDPVVRDIEYQKRVHDYPYYIHQNLYQHPYFSSLVNKYHDETLRGMDIHRPVVDDVYKREHNYPYYQHHEGYYYPYNVGYYHQQGDYVPTQGYVHPFLHKMLGYGYHHYPQYQV